MKASSDPIALDKIAEIFVVVALIGSILYGILAMSTYSNEVIKNLFSYF